MNADDLQKIIAQDEGQTVEFKSAASMPSTVAEARPWYAQAWPQTGRSRYANP